MRRCRRRSASSRLLLLGVGLAALGWLWGRQWGRAALGATAVTIVAAGLVLVARAPARRRARLRRLATLEGLLDLTPLQFEHEVAHLLATHGFTGVEVLGGAGDLQADILATDPEGRTTIVQCKRYARGRAIGSAVVQSFIGMARIHHACERAMIVTTASFTAPAERLADEHDIELVDGTDLVAWCGRRASVGA